MNEEKDIAAISARMERLEASDAAERQRMRAIRKLREGMTRRAGDGTEIGGTWLTILKHMPSAIGLMIDRGDIGAEELRAADEIAMAIRGMAGELDVRSPSLEKRDRGYDVPEPSWMIDAQRRYRAWAEFWRARVFAGDFTFGIVVAVAYSHRTPTALDAKLGLRNGTAKLATIRGLRDYSARAEPSWIDDRLANQWMTDAALTFRARAA